MLAVQTKIRHQWATSASSVPNWQWRWPAGTAQGMPSLVVAGQDNSRASSEDRSYAQSPGAPTPTGSRNTRYSCSRVARAGCTARCRWEGPFYPARSVTPCGCTCRSHSLPDRPRSVTAPAVAYRIHARSYLFPLVWSRLQSPRRS
jgi:hypothetical protein